MFLWSFPQSYDAPEKPEIAPWYHDASIFPTILLRRKSYETIRSAPPRRHELPQQDGKTGRYANTSNAAMMAKPATAMVPLT
jgi:hypothetical protein